MGRHIKVKKNIEKSLRDMSLNAKDSNINERVEVIRRTKPKKRFIADYLPPLLVFFKIFFTTSAICKAR